MAVAARFERESGALQFFAPRVNTVYIRRVPAMPRGKRNAETRICCECHRFGAPPLMTYEEAGELLRVHPRTIRNWCDDGRLERVELTSAVQRVTRASVEILVESGRVREPRRPRQLRARPADEPPPPAGPGGGREAWAEWAESKGIRVSPGTLRHEIQAACWAADLLD
jgi:hypothetical protein